MVSVSRVLDLEPVSTFGDYVGRGGGRGLATAADLGPSEVVQLVVASGLRGRGGAGFPTGVKWRAVLAANSGGPVTVVVNAAEGEPGTFKDRALIRRNPYRVLEGALIAAYAMTAPRVIVATKASFATEVARLRDAIAELAEARVAADIAIEVVGGPDSYLFGEETALLEVVDGRQPFPRVAPPYRRGLDPDPEAPVLVDNVETLANVPAIVAEGPGWFRSVGTSSSPGTIVCTVSGDVQHHGVAEFAMGTPMREVIETIGRGPLEGRQLVAAIAGTANAIVTADDFGTPMCYEAMTQLGSGLGTGGLIVFDDSRHLLDVGHAVAHFLAIESCGQCEPCKLDGQAITVSLGELVNGRTDSATTDDLRRRVGSVARGARCALARQQEAVTGDLLIRCGDELEAHADSGDPVDAEPVLVAPIVDLVDGRFVLDTTFASKQPDWSHDEVDSGKFPVDRLSTGVEETGRSPERELPTEAGKPRRDPFAALLDVHETIRDDLDAVMGAPVDRLGDATERLADHLLRHIELGDRLIYPMVQRVTATGDDAVWSAELHALDALRVTAELHAGGGGVADRRRYDRLANDVRRNLDENERVVYPLLRQHLDEEELTDLADAVEEILAERVVR